MSQPDAVFLDANIPMYAAGGEHEYRAPCQVVLRRVVAGELAGLTNTEVHQEILHRYLSIGLSDKAREVSADFEIMVPWVLGVSLEDIRVARNLLASYPKLPARDLIHVAVMLNNGVTRIISADRHFDEVPQVLRLDPVSIVREGTLMPPVVGWT
jgi:predicted nucleic acid-binding protein